MPLSSKHTLFNRKPLAVVDQIPVFSAVRPYVLNYQKIASDHIASIAPGKSNPFIEDDLWIAMENTTREIIIKHVGEGARVLDAGVGLGRVLNPCPQFDRHGIDISFNYLSYSSQRGIKVAFSLIEDMPYKDDVFDAVVACDVLEHVFDLAACSQQLLRVLKPNGKLILRVPYKEDLEVYLREDLSYEFIHLRNFDVSSLRLHFEKMMGCKYVEHMFSVPYLQGSPRLKFRGLSANNGLFSLLQGLSSEEKASWPPGVLEILSRITACSDEQVTAWLYELKGNHPSFYYKLEPFLVLPIEVSIVFKKGR